MIKMNLTNALVLTLVIVLVLVLLGPVLGFLVGVTIDVIFPLLYAMIAGTLAGRLLRGRGFGPIGDVLLGLAGGVVGYAVLDLLNQEPTGVSLLNGMITSVIGALVLVALVRLFVKRDFAN